MTARRALVAAGICVLVVSTAGVGLWAVSGVGDEPASAAGPQPHQATTTVVRGDLTDSRSFAGTLGYGTPTGVPGAAHGTLTAVAAPGDVVHRDEPLYAVDERAVRTMHGTTPLWRDLAPGLRGADVRQLNENLAALGYDVAPDDTFGPRTGRAVLQWQRDRGHEPTGRLTAADVVFVDGDVRVASVVGSLGSPVTGEVLRVTSTRRVVAATVPQRDVERLAVGTAVTVVVNGSGGAMAGEVVDTRPATGEDASTEVDVTVSFDPGDRTLPDAGSARIDAAGETARDVLSVPVQALLAGAGDRFAVEVSRGDATRRVRVEPGFVADGRIAVTGALRPGDHVVVPG